MTVHQGETADCRLKLRQFADRHYDVLTFFPIVLAVSLFLAVILAVKW